MATSLLELIMNRLRLILADVVEDVQILFFFLAQAGVELMRYHFVDATLSWKQLTLWNGMG